MNIFKRLLLLSSVVILFQANADDYRLPKVAVPQHQTIYLKLDPNSIDFTGSTTIDIKVDSPTRFIAFHQADLDLKSVVLAGNGQKRDLSIEQKPFEIVHGISATEIEPGNYQLLIEFNGTIKSQAMGLYNTKFQGNTYIYTQFSEMMARRAIPMFDEPHFKIPYSVTLTAPRGNEILANTPEIRRTTKDNWDTVTFEKTKPMPSYLLAFAVGPMDKVDIPGMGIPGSIYTVKGQGSRTSYAVAQTPKILKALEEYFGMKYPYRKLDFLAVPDFTFGAMENVGLVTYRASLLVMDEDPPLQRKRSSTGTITHELAHSWFGNLVTLAWWDDYWLNEAFATWMTAKIVNQLYPEFLGKYRLPQTSALYRDSYATSKPIKRIIKTEANIADGSSMYYSKGSALLNIAEAYVGESKFRQGMKEYVREKAWQNATADDLWNILSKYSDKQLPNIMNGYLKQAGFPLLSFSEDGGISQSRYARFGDEVQSQQWALPIHVTYKKDGWIKRKSIKLFSAQSQANELEEADWVFPDTGALGYYRWKISSQQWGHLVKDVNALDIREKKALVDNSAALVAAGVHSADKHLSLLNALLSDRDLTTVSSAISEISNYYKHTGNEADRKAFSSYLNTKLTSLINNMGYSTIDGESQAQTLLRPGVIGLLSVHSSSESVQKELENLANKFLSDPTSVPTSIASSALRFAAVSGDSSRFEQYWKTFVSSSDPAIRNTLIGRMHFSHLEALEDKLNLVFDEQVGAAQVVRYFSAMLHGSKKKEQIYSWIISNLDKLKSKMPDHHIGRLPEHIGGNCKAEDRQLLVKHFESVAQSNAAIKRSLDVKLGRIDQCLQTTERESASIGNFLSSQ